jgi:para-aminobenzoate synthetase component 2
MVKSAPKILVLDNYDSFVFNLVSYLEQLGAEVKVLRNDEIAATEASAYDGVLISPGPGRPEDAGISVELVKYCAAQSIPLLGVCLGHQAIAIAFGARIINAPELLHGMTSSITHNSLGIFTELPSPYLATRYHSLLVDQSTVPQELEVSAETASGEVMAIAHKELPIFGVQFHPESVLTEHGHALLQNWLNLIY